MPGDVPFIMWGDGPQQMKNEINIYVIENVPWYFMANQMVLGDLGWHWTVSDGFQWYCMVLDRGKVRKCEGHGKVQ